MFLAMRLCFSLKLDLATGTYATRWDGVKRLKKEQKTKRKRKVPGCSSIEVDGFMNFWLGMIGTLCLKK
ncbi:unnamed protein product [Victoria cruziana]